jgi:hypothetical protein
LTGCCVTSANRPSPVNAGALVESATQFAAPCRSARSPTGKIRYPDLEVDFVEHCGGTKIDGDFVHSFVMTDIATGWTECLAMPYRSGAFVLEHIERVSRALPFPLRGIDCDNDSAF